MFVEGTLPAVSATCIHPLTHRGASCFARCPGPRSSSSRSLGGEAVETLASWTVAGTEMHLGYSHGSDEGRTGEQSGSENES